MNCGFPDIPENDVLKVVGSDRSHTQYEDKIQFNCSSKFYIMEGDGDYKMFMHPFYKFFSELTFIARCHK